MEVRRVLILIFTLLIAVECKVYSSRCHLARDLLKNEFSRTFLSNWVCLVEQVSDRNTSLITTKSSRRKYYGLFQIGSEWCREGKKGGKCNIPCEALTDDDIRDDCVCANKVFADEGFKYWSKWESRCKGQTLPDINRCPDFQYPSSRSSVSPSRDRRSIDDNLMKHRRFLVQSYHRLN